MIIHKMLSWAAMGFTWHTKQVSTISSYLIRLHWEIIFHELRFERFLLSFAYRINNNFKEHVYFIHKAIQHNILYNKFE